MGLGVPGGLNYPAGPSFGSIDNISGGGGLGGSGGSFPPLPLSGAISGPQTGSFLQQAPQGLGSQGGLGSMVGAQLGPAPQAPQPFHPATPFPTAPPPLGPAAAPASAPAAAPVWPTQNLLSSYPSSAGLFGLNSSYHPAGGAA